MKRTQLTDDDELDEEAAGRMSRQLAFVQSSVSLLDEADLQGPILSMHKQTHTVRNRTTTRIRERTNTRANPS